MTSTQPDPQSGGGQMLTLFARQEPTVDALAPKRMDTVFYKDRAYTLVYARWV